MESKNLVNALVAGKWAALATSAAVMACGARENHDAVSPINAVSHIAWGDEAFDREDVSVKYTFAGLALNAAATVSWAVILEMLFGRFARRAAANALVSGAAVSGLAYLVDYHAVPPRLTPGFEKHLSPRALFLVYVVLAASLAAGALANRDGK
jgi:hypothetical protein